MQSPRHSVHLPPSRHSDFVIHFLNTDFYVHQLVLQHHSAYFRTLFEAFPRLKDLTPTDASGRTRKRRIAEGDIAARDNASSSPSSSAACDHSALIPCVHLPDRVGREVCSEEEFHLFLRHLYFCDVLCCPPFHPPADRLEGLTDATPLSFAHPTGGRVELYSQPVPIVEADAAVGFIVGRFVDALDSAGHWLPALIQQVSAGHCLVHFVGWHSRWDEWLPIDSPRLAPLYSHPHDTSLITRHGKHMFHRADGLPGVREMLPPPSLSWAAAQSPPAYSRPLLSLFDYFHCPAMLQRCDAVLCAEVPTDKATNAQVPSVIEYLEVALSYRLISTESRCVTAVRAMLMHQMAAMQESMSRLPPDVFRCILQARGELRDEKAQEGQGGVRQQL